MTITWTPPADRVCGTCGTSGGGGHVAVHRPGTNGGHWDIVDCPACGGVR